MQTTLHEETRWAGVREVLRMGGPVIVSTLSWTAMQFVDQIMVARLGADELAAVGSAGLWSFTLATFFLGVVGCVTTFVSQSLGRGEKENCARYAWQGIYIALVTGAAAVLLWPISNPLFHLMGHTPAVTQLEVIYFRVRLFGYVFISWHVALACFFQSVRKPRIPMYVSVMANVLNVVLDYLLIYGKFGFPQWGIAGAAIATVAALALQVLLLQVLFLSGSTHREFNTRGTTGWDRVKIRELFRIGWPAGVSNFMDLANWGVFTSFIVGHFGTTALAAHAAATNIMHVSFMPAVGLSAGVAPIVGQWIGRGDIAAAKARTYTALRMAVAYMFTIGVCFVVFGRPAISLFSQDPDVVRLGYVLLVMAAVFQSFDATNIVMMGALRGAGDTRWVAVTMFLVSYLVFLPLAVVFAWAARLGAVGAWLGATVFIIGLSMVLLRRFRSEGWRKIRIFSTAPEAGFPIAPAQVPVEPTSVPETSPQ
jgi:multidrug resistance protein, MATE family